MDSNIIEKPASSYFEKDENGMLTVSKETVRRLEEIGKEQNGLATEEKAIRAGILDGLIANNIEKCSAGNMSFTQVIPKPKASFDVDSFLLNEPEDVVNCFTSYEESEEFDVESFKKDNPELYRKYTKKEIMPIVDTAKMQKALEPIFRKYYSEIPSDKPATLRISAKKGSK